MTTQNLYIKQFKKTLSFLGLNILILICIQSIWHIHEQNHKVYTKINHIAEQQRVYCQMISQELLFLHQYPHPLKLDSLKKEVAFASEQIDVLQLEFKKAEKEFAIYKHADIHSIHHAFLNVDKHSYQISHVATQVLYFMQSNLDQTRKTVINRYFKQLEKHEFAYLQDVEIVFNLLEKANTRFQRYTSLYEAVSFCISLSLFVLILLVLFQLRKQKLINEMLPSQFIDQNSSDVVFITDKETKVIWANPKFNAFIGKNIHEIRNYKLWHILPNDTVFNQVIEELKIAWANKKRLTTLLSLSDGTKLQLQMSPVLDANMEIEKCIFRISDLPQNTSTTNDQYYQSILEAIPDLIFVNDLNGIFKEYYYKDADQLFIRENFIGRKVVDILPPNIADQVLTAFQKAVETKDTVDIEYEMTTSDNEVRFFHARIACFSEKLVLTIVRDITDTQKPKEELLKLNSRLEEIVNLRNKRYAESEEKFKLLFENANDGILLLNKEFNILESNPKALILFQHEDKNEFIGKNFLDFCPAYQTEEKTSQKTFEENIEEAVRHTQNTFHWNFKLENDFTFTAEISLTFLQIQEEDMLLLNLRDITQKLEQERALKDSEEKYKLLTENTGDLVVLFDQSGKCMYVSPSSENIIGYPPEELKQKEMFELLHSDDIPKAQQCHLKLLKEGSVKDFKYRNIHKEGHPVWFSSTVNHVQEKEQSFIVVVSRDISEQVRTEEQLHESRLQLKESEERYRLLAENTSDVVVMSYDAGIISFVTPSILGLLNYTQAEMYNLSSPAEIIHEADLEMVYKYAKQVFKTQEIQSFECRMLNAQKEIVWVEVAVSPIFKENEIAGTLYSIRNIAERKKAEDEILKALTKEKQVSELQKRFISIASHEFRTPLTTISSSVGILSLFVEKIDSDLHEKFTKHLDRIANAGDRLVHLMNDILLIGRIEAERTPFSPTENNPVAFIESIILQYFSNQGQEKIKINAVGHIQEVSFDTNLMTHVFNNLISNAIKYSPKEKTPELNILCTPENIEFNVIDRGIGIPKEDQANLFQSFFRASNVGKIEGTGLGLVIAKEFVQMHSGELTFESALNEGTCFTVKLPIHQHSLVAQN